MSGEILAEDALPSVSTSEESVSWGTAVVGGHRLLLWIKLTNHNDHYSGDNNNAKRRFFAFHQIPPRLG